MNQTCDLDKSEITSYCHTTTNEVATRLTDVVKYASIDQQQNKKYYQKTKKSSMLANLNIKRW